MSASNHYRGDGYEADGHAGGGFLKRSIEFTEAESTASTSGNYAAPETIEIESRERALFHQNLPEWLFRLLEGEARPH